VGKNHAKLENCTVKFNDEIMKIEKPSLLTERTENWDEAIPLSEFSNVFFFQSLNNYFLGKLPLYCNKCKDVVTKKCRECGCYVCAEKESRGTLMLCDECDRAYHLSCLDPPLSEVPSDPEWYSIL
jgi:E3 ubiquitin-protein ligase UHRF1